jgi:hypothetical protein
LSIGEGLLFSLGRRLFVDLVSGELPAKTLVVAIDPGKVFNRVLLADGERGSDRRAGLSSGPA